MFVRRVLRKLKGYLLGSALLPNHVNAAPVRTLMDGNAALQVRKKERGLAVSSIGCADEIVKGVVPRNALGTAVTKRPTGGRIIETDQANFAYVRITHPWTSRGLCLNCSMTFA
jgi:hypothetical protein